MWIFMRKYLNQLRPKRSHLPLLHLVSSPDSVVNQRSSSEAAGCTEKKRENPEWSDGFLTVNCGCKRWRQPHMADQRPRIVSPLSRWRESWRASLVLPAPCDDVTTGENATTTWSLSVRGEVIKYDDDWEFHLVLKRVLKEDFTRRACA